MFNTILKKFYWRRTRLGSVFTHSNLAGLTYISRNGLEMEFHKALNIPGMQIVFCGEPGSGKSSFLANALSAENRSYISTHCSPDNSLKDLLMDAFKNMSQYTQHKPSFFSRYYNRLKIAWWQRSLFRQPLLVSFQTLGEYLGALNCIWVIEDFHRVKKSERQMLLEVVRIFSNLSNRYSQVKLIITGLADTATEMFQCQGEVADLENRITELQIPLFSNGDLAGIINKGEQALNISFSGNTRRDIVWFSNALPGICQAICYDLCYEKGIVRRQKQRYMMDESEMKNILSHFIQRNRQQFKHIASGDVMRIEGLLNEPSGMKDILKACCSLNRHGVTADEILGFGNNKDKYNECLNKSLYYLTTPEAGSPLRYSELTETYSFSNPWIHSFVLLHFAGDEEMEQLRGGETQPAINREVHSC